MFSNYLYKMASAKYENKVLLIDEESLEGHLSYVGAFVANGFEVVKYTDDLIFRIEYENKLLKKESKIVVIAEPNQYIPFDILKKFRVYRISITNLFSRLNTESIRHWEDLDLDMLSSAYCKTYDSYSSEEATNQFIREKVYAKDNIEDYLAKTRDSLVSSAKNATKYTEWFYLAEEKARIDVLALRYDICLDTSVLNSLFRDYVLENYAKLSAEISTDGPVLVSRAMEYMSDHSDKFVIVVMDGMSEFDWRILSKSFSNTIYEKTSSFAMIPTVTSISRQCLLSNKYPSQLMNPWKQSKEKQEFTECAIDLGYSDKQIGYERGYDASFGPLIQCGAVIINEIDDMVHGQKQGRIGMYSDIGIMTKQGKLANMVHRFVSEGFDVYITADHGNTSRTGMGRLTGTGVETETKSRCMIVLKDFANKEELKEKYKLIEFPKTYLPKEYDYLICDVGCSFDIDGEDVMSHGGISLDECIVPFIKIKAVQNNG